MKIKDERVYIAVSNPEIKYRCIHLKEDFKIALPDGRLPKKDNWLVIENDSDNIKLYTEEEFDKYYSIVGYEP